MTPAQLIAARDGAGNAAAAARTLWKSIVGDPDAVPPMPDRVEAEYAAASLDLIGQHVGRATEVPDAVLREAVTRLGLYLSLTEATTPFKSLKVGDGSEFELLSEFHGSALRRSGVMGLLGPWATPTAGVI